MTTEIRALPLALWAGQLGPAGQGLWHRLQAEVSRLHTHTHTLYLQCIHTHTHTSQRVCMMCLCIMYVYVCIFIHAYCGGMCVCVCLCIHTLQGNLYKKLYRVRRIKVDLNSSGSLTLSFLGRKIFSVCETQSLLSTAQSTHRPGQREGPEVGSGSLLPLALAS